MESKSSRERPEDQLQGLVVQDQTVQPEPAQTSLSPIAGVKQETKSEKVVIQFGDGSIKGYLESHTWNTIEELLDNAPGSPPTSFKIRRLGSETVEEISTVDAKAIFYVNDFDGDEAHRPLQFHSHSPIVHGVWVRVEFLDGEVLEGIVHNTIHYIVDPGFFLQPTDPESNNRLVYITKSWLKDHRVLGVRRV